MLELRNVTKEYLNGHPVLCDISLRVEQGEFVSITGQSGAGKSTLLKLLMAAERPTKGTIEISKWDITKISRKEIPFLRRQLGVVFQDFKLLPRLTAGENIAFALEVAGAPSGRIRRTARDLLRLVGLPDAEDMYPWQLSGGEQQRVVIARALVHQPKLLMADEPTGNLDATHTRDVITLLEKINGLGTTVLLVTHNRDVVNSLHKRVVTLDKGTIISDQAQGRYVVGSSS